MLTIFSHESASGNPPVGSGGDDSLVRWARRNRAAVRFSPLLIGEQLATPRVVEALTELATCFSPLLIGEQLATLRYTSGEYVGSGMFQSPPHRGTTCDLLAPMVPISATPSF